MERGVRCASRRLVSRCVDEKVAAVMSDRMAWGMIIVMVLWRRTGG